MPPGETMVGAGMSGQLAMEPLHFTPTPPGVPDPSTLQALAVGPGVAPWVSGRMGLPGSNEAGLTYTGHVLRVDARHAFAIGKAALSIGLGANAILALRPGDSNANGVYGGGADVPILIGVHSSSDLYAFWFGPRGGFDLLAGGLELGDATTTSDVHARHFYGGLVAGVRVGFRHVHLALELDAAYHHVDGTFQPTLTPAAPSTSATLQQISLAPAGALEVTF
jgi:hypothetical protein